MVEKERKYFFDTYAILAMIYGDTKYQKYTKNVIVTSLLNIGELYLYHLRKFNKQTAEYWNKTLHAELIDINNSIITDAMEFKFKNKRFSLPDCIGYTMAKKKNLTFLTGDDDFKDLQAVEFVEKASKNIDIK